MGLLNVSLQDAVDDVDFPKVKTDAEVAAEMGEIRVSIYRSREEACGGGVVTPALKNAPTEIAEKALKGRALSHGIWSVLRLLRAELF